MDCRTFIERLDDLISGTLRPSERRAAEAHRAACAECRDLGNLLAASPGEGGAAAPPGFLGGVLERTSGGSCRSAHRRLCDHVDGVLDAVDDELLRPHLNDCPECAGLALSLVRMKIDLPALAELQPDGRFLADVLARTTARERFTPGWAARLAEGWQRLLQRPRFAFEGAYLGSIILVMLFGSPTSPLAGVPQRALDLVRSNPVAGLRTAGEEVAPWIHITVPPQWKEKGAELAGRTRELADDVARRSSGRLEELEQDLGTLWERLTSERATNDTNGTATGADRVEGEDQ